jgi:hypothetical protein
VSHPPPGQPWYPGQQPDPNQPQYGGYPGGPTSGTGPSWPDQNQPYSGGPAYPQQPAYGDPNYGGAPASGGPAYQPESYTTEPPYSGQPYSAAPYDQGYGQTSAPPAYTPQPAYPQQAQPTFPQPTPPSNRPKGGLIALVASLGVLVLLICGISAVAILRNDDKKDNPTVTQPTTDPSTEPTDPATTPAGNGEYPATITLPDSVAGMKKLDNPALTATANETATKIKAATNADSAVAGYYAENGDVTRAVGIVGATTQITDPETELKSAFESSLNVTGLQKVDAGPLGGVMECGVTSSDGAAMTICGWADGGSLALGIFLNRSLSTSATLFVKIRGEILHRG